MIFPNGVVKEGFFELNVYKGPKLDVSQGKGAPAPVPVAIQ
jgi:hypothetical protein